MEIVTDYDAAYSGIVSSGTSTLGILGGLLIFLIILFIIFILVYAFEIVCIWIIFKKNGVKGWHAIVPFLNIWDLAVLGGQKGWKIFIPFYNIYIGIVAMYNLPIRMGKSKTLAILHIFFPYVVFPILAFSKNKENVVTTEIPVNNLNSTVVPNVVNNSESITPGQSSVGEQTTIKQTDVQQSTMESPIETQVEIPVEESVVPISQETIEQSDAPVAEGIPTEVTVEPITPEVQDIPNPEVELDQQEITDIENYQETTSTPVEEEKKDL